jgi:hypothetical protein
MQIDKAYKGYYTRVKAHILHEGGFGVDACAHTRDTQLRGGPNLRKRIMMLKN